MSNANSRDLDGSGTDGRGEAAAATAGRGRAAVRVRRISREKVVNGTPAESQRPPIGTSREDRAAAPAAGAGGEPLPPDGVTAAAPARPRKMPDPLEDEREVFRGRRAGDRAVRIVRPPLEGFRRVGANVLEASPEAYRARGRWGRVMNNVKRVLIGAPIATAHQMHERLTKKKALAIFSSDALSSVAYATEAALRQLMLAGALALTLTLPISIAIIALLAIVVFSYRQTVFAYPTGGGSYRVAKENLGTIPGLVAGAAILVDYVLTVAVSIAAGVAAITSAYGELQPYRVELCLFFIVLITVLNLRGVGESGTIFAIPTYIFLATMLGMIGWGIVRMANGVPFIPDQGAEVHNIVAQEPLTIFLILRAFASGCSALTGVEAITDGVPAFKPPESRNAAVTLGMLGLLLGLLFAGTSVLAAGLKIVPVGGETLLSQIGHYAFGSGPLYLLLQFSTMAILVLAANTAFADFPRLSSVMARDNFLAGQFKHQGDRLAFTNGIILLGVLAAVLDIIYGGEEQHILPLYTVGVFLSFTLSQSGMVMRWVRNKGANWRVKATVNAVGAITTGVVLIVVASAKFVQGAWMVITLIPILVLLFLAVERHYRRVSDQLVVTEDDHTTWQELAEAEHTILIPVADLNRPALRTLAYAKSLAKEGTRVQAVHVTSDESSAEHLQRKWDEHGVDVPLVIVESPYRAFLGPLLSYIDALEHRHPESTVTVILPEFLPAHAWEYLLHTHTALRLKGALLFRPRTVVASVPYHLAH